MKVPMPIVAPDVARLAREMAVWGKVPVFCFAEFVDTTALAATQDEVSERIVDELSHVERDLPPIDVADIDGVLVVVNGHHRATAAILGSQSEISALVRRRASEASP